MKNLLILILLFTSIATMASEKYYYTGNSWFGPWPLQVSGIDGVYQSTVNGTPFAEAPVNSVTNRPYDIACVDIVDKMGDDLTKPNYESASNVVLCDSEEDCISKESLLTCPETHFVVRVADNSKVYCTTVLSYDQKVVGKIGVLNEDKKTAFDAAAAIKAAQDAAVQMALKAMDSGRTIIATVAVRNVQKGLSTAQVSAFLIEFASVKAMLETGSLVTAKEAVLALAVSENITQEDKDFVVGLINSALGI